MRQLVYIIISFWVIGTPAATIHISGLPYSVGLSSVNITPYYPVRLNGYLGRNAESTNAVSPLFAKALAIGTDREGPAVAVTVDNCIVPYAIYMQLADRMSKHGVTREKFVILVSHSHTAPKLAGAADNIYGADIPAADQEHIERYTGDFINDVEQAAVEALKNRQPARLGWGQTSAGFGKNRRTQNGPTDHDVPVLVVTAPNGTLRGLLINYACHCTTLDGAEKRMCADWAGFAQQYLEESFPGIVAMTGIGCGADQNPNPRPGLEAARRHGHELASAVTELIDKSLTPLKRKLECRATDFELPLDVLPSREEFQKRATDPDKTHYPVIYHAKKQLARLDRGEKLAASIPYRVQEWNFGKELLMTFLPGEVVVDYALRQKKEFDRGRLWVNGYCNFVPCYIPSKRIWTEGGYEGGAAMTYYDLPTRLSDKTEENIFAGLHKVVPKAFYAEHR